MVYNVQPKTANGGLLEYLFRNLLNKESKEILTTQQVVDKVKEESPELITRGRLLGLPIVAITSNLKNVVWVVDTHDRSKSYSIPLQYLQ